MRIHLRKLAGCTFAVCGLLLMLTPGMLAADADATSNLRLVISRAKPRAVEALTADRIARDYGEAWANLAEAFDSGAPELISAHFTSPAQEALSRAIADQNKNGLHSRYLSPTHSLVAVFYAPEGDVMQLHDTLTCELQLVDGANVIHDERVTLYYIVLMTPGVDRWVVRQLQAVPSF